MLGIYPAKLAVHTLDLVGSAFRESLSVESGEVYERGITRAERKQIADALAAFAGAPG